ncbi:hypothetical protein PC111_g20815 [Phytophthora cactorum]|nr:hypothetical protein PC111_g20815 [Phytophthora cactorum]KAG2801894.1 hypothetical protein PC112_g19852 [Phytophthora cactorum]KAG2877393.1 hypothetical protein PC114_g23656 [Phytophthora cactorum]
MIPKHLVIKLSAVVGAEKMKRKGSDYFDNNSESDHPEGTRRKSLRPFLEGRRNLPVALYIA